MFNNLVKLAGMVSRVLSKIVECLTIPVPYQRKYDTHVSTCREICDGIFVHLFVHHTMDLFPNEQNFDLDKSRQKFHHSLKEHCKSSNIPKFRCEML